MTPSDLCDFEAMPFPTIVLDRKGLVAFWNKAHSAIVGYPSDDAIGRNIREFLTAESGSLLIKEMASLSTGIALPCLELGWRAKTGEVVTLAFSAQVGSCTAGEPAFIVMTGVPMPVRRDSDPPESVARAPGLLVLEPNGRVVFNRRAEEVLGMRLSCAAGNEQYLPFLRQPNGTSLTLDELPSTQVLRRGEVVAAKELLLHRPDGTATMIRESASPVFGPEGSLTGCVVIIEEMTARKQHQTAVRASHAKYQEIVSQSVDAIIAIDAEQRIVLFNRGAEHIFGWSAEEVIGQAIDILIPPYLRKRHGAAVEEFARGLGNTRRMAEERPTVTGRRKNGDAFPVEADIYKVGVEGATLLVAILRDISARKRQENKQTFLAHVSAMLASSLEYEETLSMVARLAVPLMADCCIVDLLEERGVRRVKVVHVDPKMAPVATALEAVQIREPRAHSIWRMLEEQRSVLLREIPAGYLEQVAQSPEHLRALQELAPVSVISVPLIARGHVLGALSFCSVRPEHIYGQDDLRLAEEIAGRAALAIDNSQLYALAQRAIRARRAEPSGLTTLGN
jgi:PAS domain S-box-containing protein